MSKETEEMALSFGILVLIVFGIVAIILAIRAAGLSDRSVSVLQMFLLGGMCVGGFYASLDIEVIMQADSKELEFKSLTKRSSRAALLIAIILAVLAAAIEYA